jgi:hypothetical protein
VVDPNNSSNVIVGAKTGVYFSYDAGVNWTGPCYTNAFVNATPPQRQDTTGLLAVNRGGTTVLYAAVGTRSQPTAVQPDLVNNGANGVYRTNMPASGCPAVANWTLLNNGFPSGTGNGTPNTARGRLEIAVAPSDPLTLYAMFANPANSGITGIWKTTDGGDTWVQTGKPANPGSQMWYDAGIKVSPTDPNVLFVNTVDLFRSSNGGGSWINLTGAYSGGPVHPDNHATAIVGGDANQLLNGNDGGIYYLSNALTATSYGNANWVSLNDTLPTIEVYHGDITAGFATAASSGATAGFQDNGSATVVFNGTPTAAAWNATNGGDGIVSRIEPVLGQRWYYSSQNGSLVVSTDGPDSPEATASGAWSSDTLSFIFLRHLPLWRPRPSRQRLHQCARLHAPDRRFHARVGNDHRRRQRQRLGRQDRQPRQRQPQRPLVHQQRALRGERPDRRDGGDQRRQRAIRVRPRRQRRGDARQRDRRQRGIAEPADHGRRYRSANAAGRLRRGGRLQREYAGHARPRAPDHLHGAMRDIRVGRQERQPA